MRLIRPTHDPKKTPFTERLEDVRRIFLALAEPLNIAYAIGALGGLRTGEVFALRWSHVDLAARRIHVRESIKGPLKDGDSRIVPVLDALLPILTEWKLKSGGAGRIIPPMRCDGKKIDKATPGNYLRVALGQLELTQPGLGWYEATRHAFASQWVLAGNSIEKLSAILGHYSVVMTERYAHLRPELFTQPDLATIAIDVRPSGAKVAEVGHRMATNPANPTANLKEEKKHGRSRPVSREPQGVNAPDTATRSSVVSTGVSALGSIAAATPAQSLSGATWDQNWIQHGELLPAPTPDLFAQAGAIVATRAVRGGATDADVAAIIARSGAQAAQLGVEVAPSASGEQRGQRHGP
jgi:hypothetical protein